jgi:hypothetical protein
VPRATVRRSPKPDSLPRESRTPGPVRCIGTCRVFRGSLGPVRSVHRDLSGLPRESRAGVCGPPGPVGSSAEASASARSIGTCWVFRGSLGPVYAVHRALSGLPRKSRPGPRAPSEPLGLPWESRAGVCGLTGLVGLRRKSRVCSPLAPGCLPRESRLGLRGLSGRPGLPRASPNNAVSLCGSLSAEWS